MDSSITNLNWIFWWLKTGLSQAKAHGNMSVFRFRFRFNIGTLTQVWDHFYADPVAMKRMYKNSQTFVCRTLGKVEFYPPEWCLSFRHSLIPTWPLNFFKTLQLPPDTRIVAFTGKPDIVKFSEGSGPCDSAWKKFINTFALLLGSCTIGAN